MMDQLLNPKTKKQIEESDLLKIIPPAGFRYGALEKTLIDYY